MLLSCVLFSRKSKSVDILLSTLLLCGLSYVLFQSLLICSICVLSQSSLIVSMDGRDVLEVNFCEPFLRQLFTGVEVIFETSGFDFTHIVHVS